MREGLYKQVAKYYDRIHHLKDYKKEVDFLEKIFRKHGLKARYILDVACGTGAHAALLVKRGYNVLGIDSNEEMLELARRKVKNAVFVKGDLRDLKLDRTFDAVICMFGSISYNRTLSELRKTLSGFRKHLRAKGIVVFDTSFLRERFVHRYRQTIGYDGDELTIARFGFCEKIGRKGRTTFSYLIREGNSFNYIKGDVHEFGLFSLSEIIKAMREAGFTAKAYWNFTMERPPRSSKAWGDFVFVGEKKT